MRGAALLQTRGRHLSQRLLGSSICSLKNTFGSSSVILSQERLDQLLESEITHFALQSQPPVTLHQILSVKDTKVAARFLHEALPARFANRIKSIEALPGVIDSDSPLDTWGVEGGDGKLHKRAGGLTALRYLRWTYSESFKQLRMSSPEDVNGFAQVLRDLKKRHATVVPVIMSGIRKVKARFPEQMPDERIDSWLDDFFRSRMGTEMLTSQFLAVHSGYHPDGIVDRGKEVGVTADFCESGGGGGGGGGG
eukprot:Cvel_27141.t1-p1 / transcript=Cvel_27141.t1 / gene=Cvel_27141 / organism=Chromera_velia_CCMP2878 / gene_product=[Pyruvate dehydrogenase (acetyl-transferring)], putative / transcript_product=[Pyruvate dehydrogenase (acetyl-transferring)], putative / location=Cvel_scaffold3338:1-1933(-) / protein_length=251 / sequence_SO=supercontig / SO=protein_coding / is_pseudo=false